MPLAQLNQRPHWLSKPGYLAFGSLRSYPMGQLARLAQALSQHVWPFERAEVRVLALQALHHVGTLHADKTTGKVEQVWRQGWLEPHGSAAALCQELGRLADELDQTPREHDSVTLLGEVAG
jgi:hypothetical protein